MNFDVAWAATHSWMLDHGWRILLIMLGTSLVRRLGVFLLGRVISKSIDHSERFESKRDRKLRANTLTGMYGSIIKFLTWTAMILLIMRELNLFSFFAPLFGQAVVVSLVIGFGIQTFVKDFISGLFIVADNQYRVGDYVSVTLNVGGSVEGSVIRITLRTTVIRDQDGAIHFVPNGNIIRSANLTLDYAKINVEVAMPLGADFAKAEEEVNQLGQEMVHEEAWKNTLLEAPYYHGVQTFDNDHVTIEVRAKTRPDEQWRVSSELQRRLAELVSKNDHFEKKAKKAGKKK